MLGAAQDQILLEGPQQLTSFLHIVTNERPQIFFDEIIQIATLLHTSDDAVTMKITVKGLLHHTDVLLNSQCLLRGFQTILETGEVCAVMTDTDQA